MPQAEGLVELLAEIGQPVDAVVSLEVPDDEVVKRLGGRLTCRECGHTTNMRSRRRCSPERVIWVLHAASRSVHVTMEGCIRGFEKDSPIIRRLVYACE